MLEFSTSPLTKKEQKEREDRKVEFKLDDRVMTAYPPKQGALLVLSASGESEELSTEAAILSFFSTMLPEDDFKHIVQLLMSSSSTFDFDDLMKIQRGLLEKMGDRPTE